MPNQNNVTNQEVTSRFIMARDCHTCWSADTRTAQKVLSWKILNKYNFLFQFTDNSLFFRLIAQAHKNKWSVLKTRPIIPHVFWSAQLKSKSKNTFQYVIIFKWLKLMYLYFQPVGLLISYFWNQRKMKTLIRHFFQWNTVLFTKLWYKLVFFKIETIASCDIIKTKIFFWSYLYVIGDLFCYY